MPLSGLSYCTTADLTSALTGLNSQGMPSDAGLPLLQLACDQATAKVSSWTGQIWGFDQSGNAITVPDLIVSITIDVACYYATLSYRKNKPLDVNDPVALRYKEAMADLKAIQEGQIEVNPVQPNQPFGKPGRVINTIPRIFTPSDSGTKLERGGVTAETTAGAGGIPGQLGY